jgi:putative heme iron utilization protein
MARGLVLRFQAGVVDAMPDELVQILIGHELGHVWQEVIGWYEWFEGKYGRRPRRRE